MPLSGMIPDMPDDKIPFSTHLTELRKRVIYVVAGIFVVFSLVFPLWADDIIRYFQVMAVTESKVDGKVLVEQLQFTALSPTETFSLTMKVSMYAAFVFAYPCGMLQLYLFVSPGLYKHERGFFKVAIPLFGLLFVAGAAFGRYVLMPISLRFLTNFNVAELDLAPMFSIGAYFNLVFALTFGLGLVFQIPLVMAPLVRYGIVKPEWIASKRKYTFFASIVLGAIISPTGQPLDMFLAGLPVFFLLELGTFAGKYWRKRALDSAAKQIEKAATDGSTINLESFGEGVSAELDARVKKFADEGARKFGQELMRALRAGRQNISKVFDDDFKDDDKPGDEVKLKPSESRRRKKKPEFEIEGATDEQPEDEALEYEADTTETDAEKNDDGDSGSNEAEGTVGTSGSPWASYGDSLAKAEDEEFPDRPWTDNFEEEQQRYIEDRISQRLEQLLDKELKPWMQRVDSQIKDIKNERSD